VVVAVKLAENCLGEGTNDTAQFLLDNMAQQWASQDMQAASAWALAKPAGGQRDRLLQHIALAESKTDPNQAAQLVAQQISPGQFQNEAAVSVVYQWAQQDAKAALTWAESFPAGDLRDRAIKEVKNVSAISAGNLPMN
jgi:thioredoxin-like negative regulator of GroEL